MSKATEIGYWLDATDRIKGIAANGFRWVFATKRRLQVVLLVLVVLATAWGCSRSNIDPGAMADPQATATQTATEKACPRAQATTEAEKAAASLSLQLCTSPNSDAARRGTAKRLLTITDEDGSKTVPETVTVENFVAGIPNQVQQVGGTEENGNSTVLATSANSRFLWTFSATGKLVEVQDITVTTDATTAPDSEDEATETPTPEASASATTR